MTHQEENLRGKGGEVPVLAVSLQFDNACGLLKTLNFIKGM